MNLTVLLVLFAIAVGFLLPPNVEAFECPKHFKEAQAAIDKVTEDMGGEMSNFMKKEDVALVYALLDDAKTLLSGAKHNHEKPQGTYDHARAIAKSDSARGYAVAADIFHWKLMGIRIMQKMK